MIQDDLEEFVRKNVKKGWMEVSNYPWIFNIFGVPKKHTATERTKRAEWLRSANTETPTPWVIDYRYAQSPPKITTISLPRIDELFDQMLGSIVFDEINLAQGYNQ